MKYKLQVYSIWEFGARKDSQGNPHQEDSMFPPFGQECPQDRTFILCDGMGGHGSGEVASAAVCEAMSVSILSDGHDPLGEFDDSDLAAAISSAYSLLDEKDTHEAKKMGTTMTFLKLHNAGATIAHIGDSRVYQIRPGKTADDTRIMYETHDHSLVNDLIKVGELTPEQARHSTQRNVITRSMMPGPENRHRADVWHTRDIKAGDYFYMCSDGMLEQDDMDSGVGLRKIFSAEGGTDELRVETLRAATEHNRDNHTAFIIHILEVIDPLPVGVPETPRILEIEQPPLLPGEQPGEVHAVVVEDERAGRKNVNAANSDFVTPGRRNGIQSAARTQNMQKMLLQKYRRIIIFLIIVIVAVIGLCTYFYFTNDTEPEKEILVIEKESDNDTIKKKPDPRKLKEEVKIEEKKEEKQEDKKDKEEKKEELNSSVADELKISSEGKTDFPGLKPTNPGGVKLPENINKPESKR